MDNDGSTVRAITVTGVPQAWAGWLGLGILIVVALYTRLSHIEQMPGRVLMDEADNLGVAYHIMAGTGPGFFGLDWKPSPAFSMYLMSFSMSVFGKTITAMRLPSILTSTLALIPFFYLAKRVVAWPAALIAGLLMITTPWYLNFSRTGWENIHTVLYELIAYYFLMRALETKTRRRWLYYGLTAAGCLLGMYGYFSGICIVITVILFFPFALLMHRSRWRDVFYGYLAMGAVIAVCYFPQWQTIVRNAALAERRVSNVYVFGKDATRERQADHQTMTGYMQRAAVNSVKILFDNDIANEQKYSPLGKPLLDPFSGVLLLIGFYLSVPIMLLALVPGVLRRWQERYRGLEGSDRWIANAARHLPLWWIGLLAPFVLTQVLTTHTPNQARGIIMAGILFLFVALGLDAISRPFLLLRSGTARERLRYAVLVALALVAIPTANGNWNAYQIWITGKGFDVYPAIASSDFEAWQKMQVDRAEHNKVTFTIDEWFGGLRAQALGTAPATGETPAPSQPPDATTQPGSNNAPVPATKLQQGGANVPVLKPGSTGTLALTLVSSFGADTKLDQPRGVAADPAGNLYVADTGNFRVVKFDTSDKMSATWGKKGKDVGDFQEPFDLAVGGEQVFVLDPTMPRLSRFTLDGKLLGVSIATAAQTGRTRGIAVDAQGNTYLACTAINQVLKLSSVGMLLAKYEQGEAGKLFDQPTGLAVASDGTTYVVEANGGVLVKLDAKGIPQAAWEIGRTDTMNAPRIAVLPSGDLLMASLAWPDQLRVYKSDGSGYTSAPIPPVSSLGIKHVSGLTVDAQGRIYMVDFDGKRIIKWSLAKS